MTVRQRRPAWGRGRTWPWLVLVVVAALWIRLDGLDWDDSTYAHPDERFMASVVGSLGAPVLTPPQSREDERQGVIAQCRARNGGAAGLGGWYDTQCSAFNPSNVGFAGYPYGLLPAVAVHASAAALATLVGDAGYLHYGGIHLVGRAFSALCDVATLLVTYLLGRLLWGRRVGLLAAALYAVAMLPIQSAHFFTVDACTTLFATLSMLFLVRIARFGERADALAFGIAYALAVASKISVAPLVLLLPLAVYWAPARTGAATATLDAVSRAALRLPELLLAGVAAAVTFRIAAPYAFAGPGFFDIWPAQAYIDRALESARLMSGEVDIPPNWQWLGRTRWLTPLLHLALWGMGPALGVAAMVAFGVTGTWLLRRQPRARARAIPWLFVLAYFLWQGAQWVSSMRYLLPLYPLLCVFTAAWLTCWWRARRLRSGKGRRRATAWASSVGAMVLVGTVVWALAYHTQGTLHPYVAATHWMLRNVPAAIAAPITAPGGDGPLVNFPATGTYGDGIAAARAAATRAPANGAITGLRLHRTQRVAGEPSIAVRLLDAKGVVLAMTARITPLAGLDGEAWDVDLPFAVPLAVLGGATYQVQVDVRGGQLALAGTAIAEEGGWNDTIPLRTAWLPPAAAFNADMASGRALRGQASVDAFGEGYYQSVDLKMVNGDDQTKRARLLASLDAAEWLVIPNNRFYDSQRRNPLRFPLSTRFYDALFTGELGFARVRVFSSPPTLLGVAIDDQALPVFGEPISERPGLALAAEEALSVYDHPAVQLFRKRGSYSRAAAERALAGLELTDVQTAMASDAPQVAGRLNWSTAAASLAPDGLMLHPRTAPLHTAPGAVPLHVTASSPDQGVTTSAPRSQWWDVIAWYGVSLLLGWLAWPWLAALWPALPDGGYGIARIAGLVAVALPVWWFASAGVGAWSRSGVAMVTLLLVLATVARLFTQPGRWQALRARMRLVLAYEAAFCALFVVGVALRLAHPDLWAVGLGGEKPMDYAFFNSVLQASAFPPADPWFAGGRLNYYYFGWILVGVLVKLTGTLPGVAYNLAVATWFAMTGLAAGSLAYNLCAAWTAPRARALSPWLAAGGAIMATVLLGNLDLPRALWPNVRAAWSVAHADAALPGATQAALYARSKRWYWAPTRTVGERADAAHEINEFPAFTFLFGDLHAHMLAMPLQLLALTAMLGLALTREDDWRSRRRLRWRMAAAVAAVGLPVGLLRATNTWDWPLYTLMGATASAWWCAHTLAQLPPWRRVPVRAMYVLRAGVGVALFAATQAAVVWPFRHFVTGSVGLAPFSGALTPLSSWLAMQGWFVLVLLAWCAAMRAAPRARVSLWRGTQRLIRIVQVACWLGGIYAVLALVLAWLPHPVAWPAAPAQLALLVALAANLWLRAVTRAEQAALLLAIVGVALALTVEFVVIGRDIGRQNTFFKLYLQSWILLSVASGVALAAIARAPWRGVARATWRTAFALATIIGLAFLPLGSFGRVHSRFVPNLPLTLDGEAFLAEARYDYAGQALRLVDDQRLIAWLRLHSATHDVVLEAQVEEYAWGSRLSSFTGRPTLLGYRFHETQQRPVPALGEAIRLRERNVQAIYGTTDAARALSALRAYDVRYVVVGGLERAVYPAEGLAKFAALAAQGELQVAYRAGDDVIYRVVARAGEATPHGPRW